MRSDGRLQQAKFLAFDVRHPIILPPRSWITKLIVKYFHEQGNHAAGKKPNIGALVGAVQDNCRTGSNTRMGEGMCQVQTPKSQGLPASHGSLPISRLTTSLHAFTKTAVDFGGPFITVQGRG